MPPSGALEGGKKAKFHNSQTDFQPGCLPFRANLGPILGKSGRQLGRHEKKMSAIKNKEQFMVCVNLYASGLVGLYQDWFNNRIKMSLDDLTLHSSEIIKNGFHAFLPKKNH